MRSRIAICLGGLALVCLALASVATAQNGDIRRTPSGRPDLSGRPKNLRHSTLLRRRLEILSHIITLGT